MDFEWTPEQRDRYEATVTAVRARWGGAVRTGPFTRDEWRACGELGLLGLPVPGEYGGGGLDARTSARVIEAFGYASEDMGLVFATMAHLLACVMPIAEHGSPGLRAALLPPLCSGEWIGANAITEEGAGSDVGALSCRAERVPGGYRIDGVKSFVSNGPVADVFLVYAVTDPELGHLGVSAFAVERDRPGLDARPAFAKLGLDACPAGELVLTGCVVPEGNLLGRPGQGSAIFQSSMRWERSCLFAGYVGAVERLLERCVERAARRRRFGRPIAANQAVAHPLVDVRLRLDAARLLLYRACHVLDRGGAAALEVSLAKLAVSETAVAAALTAVQVFGGDGYRGGPGIERMLRDTVPGTLFSGTSEMQREIVAREMGL